MTFLNNIYYGNGVFEWGLALLIILGAFIGGKIVYWILKNFIGALTSKTKTKLDDIVLDMIEEPIMLAIVLGGFWFGFKSLSFGDAATAFLGSAIMFVVIMNVAWFISRLFQAIFEEYVVPLSAKTETDFDDQILPIARRGIVTVIWVLAIIIGLDNAGYNVGALLAGLGIGGLALALAAKDTISNIFGGLVIFMDKPFKIKDRIRISGFDGTIKEIGLRNTKMATLDGTEVTIPNSTFTGGPVENVTREPSRKVTLNLGLTYDTSPEKMKKAMKILEGIAKKNKGVNDKYKIAFNAFGDFSLGILFIYYIKKSANILEVQSEVNLAILKEFGKAKLDMAFPTQTIELRK